MAAAAVTARESCKQDSRARSFERPLEFLHFGRERGQAKFGEHANFSGATALVLPVSGHDFSRAAQAQQKIWALAPALSSWPGK